MSKIKGSVWCEKCGCVMKVRTGKFGNFYGCTGYPICKATKSLEEVLSAK